MGQLDRSRVFPLKVLRQVDQGRLGVGEAGDGVLDPEVRALPALDQPQRRPHPSKPSDDLQAAVGQRADEDRVELA
ncbi:MAG: hypothetical protein BGO49_22570 [Planctomycetales bacterium 71-10]|nr:MAG: hypothetical protein BGO49_22570 [Planctomycetales bacterium 71-10]